nr:uncharacterized protein LOC119182537 [Rhipicephalus microplus]
MPHQTPHQTPTASPASPDQAAPQGVDDPSSSPRPVVVPTEPQVEPPPEEAPLGERVADADVISVAHPMAAQSSVSPPIIEETLSQGDEVSINEDTSSTRSDTALQIE